MSSLKFTKLAGLSGPKKPTRTSIQNSNDALHRLGFDAKFDIQIERTVDRITASDTKLEERLKAAVSYSAAREPLGTLPCGFIRLVKPLREDPDPCPDGGLENIANLVIAVLPNFHVQPDDIKIERIDPAEEETGGEIICDIHVRGGQWMLAIEDVLKLHTKDKGGGLDRGDASGIHRGFFEAGGPENLTLTITPMWPMERITKEIQLASSAYAPTDEQMAELLEVAAASRKAYNDVWNELAVELKEDVEELFTKVSMASFDGQLLPCEDGRKHGLREDQFLQEATSLTDLIADAAQAQQQLKATLAPRTTWAAGNFDDMYEVPFSEQRRTWSSNSGALAPDGDHFDPGIKGERACFEKAKSSQWPYQLEPPVDGLLDVSRLSIIFATIKELSTALQRILETHHLKVIWVNNEFIEPPPLGYRSVSIGIRQQVDSRQHISTLRLHLQPLVDVKSGAAAAHYISFKGALSKGGVRTHELTAALRASLRAITCTAWRSARNKLCELIDADEYCRELLADCGDAERALAEQLQQQVVAQAMAAGVLMGPS